jgi:hypothetical protein
MAKLLVPVGLLLLALGAAGCAQGTPRPAAPPATTAPAIPAGWPAFTSRDGGYRLRYPPGWRVKESFGDGGPVLSLLPPRGAGISVLVLTGAPPQPDPGSPNVRCQALRTAAMTGARCVDTIAMVVRTTLHGGDRWFVVTTSLRRPAAPAGAYDRVLASLRPA